MERSFTTWLISKGMSRGLSGFLSEIHFKNPETKKNGWADFVFPRRRLILELDGTHHRKRQHLDAARDEYLDQRGWKVVRITHAEYRSGSRIPEIQQLLGV
jgi:very-short-patch-repair endonuclease